MQFEINSKILEKEVAKVMPATNKVLSATNNVDAIMMSVKFSEETLTYSLIIIGASDQITLTTCTPIIHADCEGTFTVPAKLIHDTLKSLPDEDIRVSSKDEKVTIATSNAKFNIKYPVEQFQNYTQEITEGREMELNGDEIKKALEFTLYIASKDDMRPALTGVLFELSTDGLTIVTTDGHRLAKVECNGVISAPLEEKVQLTIPAKALTSLIKYIDGESIKIQYNKYCALFEVGTIQMYVRLIKYNYPNYREVIPLESKISTIVSTNDMLNAVKSMKIYTDVESKKVIISMSKNKITLSSKDLLTGNCGEIEIDCYNETDFEIGFNGNLLLDCLSHIREEQIMLKFNDPTKAAVIYPVYTDDSGENIREEYLELLMPVRINS